MAFGYNNIIKMKQRSVKLMSKQQILDMLTKMPDEIMFDRETIINALYDAYIKAGVKKGLEDIEAGRTYTQEQVEAMFCV